MNRYRSSIGLQDITPPDVFFDRRKFVQALGLGAAAIATGSSPAAAGPLDIPLQRPDVYPTKRNEKYKLPEGVDQELTPRRAAATHNNFYEFLPGRGGPVWKFTDDFQVAPWKVEVTGLVNKPKTFDLDDIFGFAHEERLYHFRCVERWAMNVPWSGFPLSKLLEKVEPKSSAKFVRFVSANVPDQMPGIREAQHYSFPYFEALRIDEAMNELAMVVTGVYGDPLLKQHGAPVRIIVPWKYGYKNPKSIVKIELVDKEPEIFWQVQPHEYGFLSNVNPNIPHPRWSQADSYWLHDQSKFKTPMFNGYAEYVSKIYPDEPTTLQKALRPGQVAR